MSSANTPDRTQDAAVELVPYDLTWPQQFQTECRLLQTALGNWLTGPIEHIGSTAIPGMIAKPIIDIMAPVQSLEVARPAIATAVLAGYVHYPYRPDVMHWFCKPSPAHRTHHLHLVPLGSLLWQHRIAFRDALRAGPELAHAYAELKRELAGKYRNDRDAYTDAKTPFVNSILLARTNLQA